MAGCLKSGAQADRGANGKAGPGGGGGGGLTHRDGFCHIVMIHVPMHDAWSVCWREADLPNSDMPR